MQRDQKPRRSGRGGTSSRVYAIRRRVAALVFLLFLVIFVPRAYQVLLSFGNESASDSPETGDAGNPGGEAAPTGGNDVSQVGNMPGDQGENNTSRSSSTKADRGSPTGDSSSADSGVVELNIGTGDLSAVGGVGSDVAQAFETSLGHLEEPVPAAIGGATPVAAGTEQAAQPLDIQVPQVLATSDAFEKLSSSTAPTEQQATLQPPFEKKNLLDEQPPSTAEQLPTGQSAAVERAATAKQDALDARPSVVEQTNPAKQPSPKEQPALKKQLTQEGQAVTVEQPAPQEQGSEKPAVPNRPVNGSGELHAADGGGAVLANAVAVASDDISIARAGSAVALADGAAAVMSTGPPLFTKDGGKTERLPSPLSTESSQSTWHWPTCLPVQALPAQAP